MSRQYEQRQRERIATTHVPRRRRVLATTLLVVRRALAHGGFLSLRVSVTPRGLSRSFRVIFPSLEPPLREGRQELQGARYTPYAHAVLVLVQLAGVPQVADTEAVAAPGPYLRGLIPGGPLAIRFWEPAQRRNDLAASLGVSSRAQATCEPI